MSSPTPPMTAPTVKPIPPATMPIPQLESLKFKASQIIESILALRWSLDAHPNAMPAWPDILSKYNILLSQTHNFSTALMQPYPVSSTSTSRGPPQNAYERIALFPSMPVSDQVLDQEIMSVLRNQQTVEVLSKENEIVKRISEHLPSRGSLAIVAAAQLPPPAFGAPKKPEYEDVLAECKEIHDAHDRRVERAVLAVNMLKDKFDWKQRVEVAEAEPEELGWDPRFMNDADAVDEDVAMEDAGDASEEEEDSNASDEDEDEFNVAGALVNGDPTTSPPVQDNPDLFGSQT